MFIVESCCCDEKEAIRVAGSEAAEKVIGLLRNVPNCASMVINNLTRVVNLAFFTEDARFSSSKSRLVSGNVVELARF